MVTAQESSRRASATSFLEAREDRQILLEPVYMVMGIRKVMRTSNCVYRQGSAFASRSLHSMLRFVAEDRAASQAANRGTRAYVWSTAQILFPW